MTRRIARNLGGTGSSVTIELRGSACRLSELDVQAVLAAVTSLAAQKPAKTTSGKPCGCKDDHA